MTKYDISHMHTILIQFPIGLNTQTNKINLLVSTILKMVTQVSIKSRKSPFYLKIDYRICPSLSQVSTSDLLVGQKSSKKAMSRKIEKKWFFNAPEVEKSIKYVIEKNATHDEAEE